MINRAFADAGIDSIVIKGASLKTYYDLGELRPMEDFDLLIRPADLDRALEIIDAQSFKITGEFTVYLERRRDVFLYLNHAIPYIHTQNDSQLDLHWRIGSQCSLAFTHDLWASSG